MKKTAFPAFVVVAIISISIWVLLLWQYFHEGIPSHSFLARKDMPSISNAWGAIVLPLIAYLTMNQVEKRGTYLPSVLSFVGALAYSATIAYCFTHRISHISSFMFQALFFWALVLPLYRLEFLLGFTMGLTLTIGAVLPTFIFSILMVASYVVHGLYAVLKRMMKPASAKAQML
jgi:hypothetical protein